MKKNIVIAGVVTILLFDLFASLASQAFDFSYPWAGVGTFVIELIIGFVAARKADANPIKNAALTTAIAGLADASLGWALSWKIGPGRLQESQVLTPALWIGTAIFVAAVAAATGAFGGFLGKKRK